MKILQVNTEKTWRGGERQTLYVCQGLIKAGCDIALLCLEGYPLAKKAKAAGITTHEVKSHRASFSFLSINGKEYDIIHAQSAKGQTNAIASKMFHQKPVVYTRRVDFNIKGGLSKWKYQQTDKLVAISTAIKNIMQKQGLSNISVIPSVVQQKKLDVERAKNTLKTLNPNDKKVIATIAAMVPHKDPLTMVAAIAELKALRDDFIFLHFGDGELEPQMKKTITQKGLQDIYHLMGYLENVEDFYSVFEVFTMSSQEEGLGSSVLDAFLYKVPVASTDAGGLKETVEDRGLLSPIHDPKALAENIHKLLNQPELAQELTTKAHKDVLGNYSLEKTTQEYLKIYQELA